MLRRWYLWVIIFSLLSVTASAHLDLWLIRPVEEFVTNNRELTIEGIVECPDVQQVAVFVNTPAGVSKLGGLEESLQSLTVDLGASYSLATLVLAPVFEGELSLGPRLVNLSFSGDGKSFQDMGIFNCTSGMGQEYGEARAEFGAVIKARFVQIDMLDGWQSGRIGVEEVGFLDPSGSLLGSRIRGLAITLDLDDNSEAYFQTNILLREGSNDISISARALGADIEIDDKMVMIKATYMLEVVVADEPITLSDGYKAEITIPTLALVSNIRKIGIFPMDVKDIRWSSYSDNIHIARGTYPVVAYEFETSAATPFPITAKDSLERQPPELVVDGNDKYPSTWMSTISALPVWLKIDLRETRSVGKVTITSRIDNKVSYGPKRLSIMLSDDDDNYVEVARCDDCSDSKSEITLPAGSTGRYVQIVIEEGKQGNNIQVNEVEFRDDEGSKIVSYVRLISFALARPAELTLFYDDADLTAAGVQIEQNLAVFSWNETMQQWDIVGGKVDAANNWVTVNLNYLSTFALFEAIPSVSDVHWSYNPFSPNGDGIADTTTISINIKSDSVNQTIVEIFDLTGERIRALVDENAQSGHISIVWDGRDENGDRVSIGPYIYQVVVGNEIRNGVLIVAR